MPCIVDMHRYARCSVHSALSENNNILLFQFIFAAILAVAAAAPSDLSYEQEDIIEILRQNIDHNDDHSYQHS